jgi:hypothetical protein
VRVAAVEGGALLKDGGAGLVRGHFAGSTGDSYDSSVEELISLGRIVWLLDPTRYGCVYDAERHVFTVELTQSGWAAEKPAGTGRGQ